jgi:hypothetical protein
MDPLQQALHTSLYANDAAMFIYPQVTDLTSLQQILRTFGEAIQATNLQTNVSKSKIF